MSVYVLGSNLVIKAIKMMIEQGCDEVRIPFSSYNSSLMFTLNFGFILVNSELFFGVIL